MSTDKPNFLPSTDKPFFSTRGRTMQEIFRELGAEVDANHHHQEGYRQAMNEAIELINRPDLKNRREIISVLEARRDLIIATDNSSK